MKKDIPFQEFLRALDMGRTPTAFPPVNTLTDGKGNFLVEIALAGYNPDSISVVHEGLSIVVTGDDSQSKNECQRSGWSYISIQIATRKFRREFTVADPMVQVEAEFKNGMLLLFVTPPKEPTTAKKIAISF